jgi:CheY-like chemotaxis protein/HPt (histidine-containing phosphotransfer) domain-containing protein
MWAGRGTDARGAFRHRPTLHATIASLSRQPPVDRRTPSTTDPTDALRALRERYRGTAANSVAAFRRLASRLAANPGASDVVEALRRELHRIHGTAGTYGFAQASVLAGKFEELAIRWAADPDADRDRRATMTEHFANALEAHIGAPAASTATQSALTAPVVAPRAAPTSVAATPAAGAPDLIVVEDDPALVDMLAYALGNAGFSFRHYATGPEALAALIALDTGTAHPVILLDIDLPGLDGLTLHERLRAERPDAYATVFLTGRGGEAEQLRAYRAGAMDYLPKPVNMRILMAKIPSWLDRSRRGR